MEGADGVDDLTFRANFTADGVAKLRERVRDKLKEFMGDYTDDTLVEYVIVLLKNGRRKEEARNELNVFLGDDSCSFVSWLWDHLGSNLNLYVQPVESCPDLVAKTKPAPGERAGGTDSHHLDTEPEKEKSNKLSRNRHSREWKGLVRDADEPPPLRSTVTANLQMEEGTRHTVDHDSHHLDSESEKEKSNKLSRSRHGREWKGLVRDADEPPPLRSAVTANIHMEDGTNRTVDHAKQSPPPKIQRKRSRPDERLQMKLEVVPKTTIGASRRLLQSAVRDAVGTPRPSSLTTEPSLKRLRSVVSTSTGDSSLEGRPQRIRSVARVPNAMAVAIKAVAEAAKDVVKVRSSGNVFDRLGRGMDVADTDNLTAFRETSIEDVGEYGEFGQIPEEPHSTYLQSSDYSGRYVRNMTLLESDAGMASDFVSDNEGYDDANVLGHRVMDVSQTGTSDGNKGDDSLMVQYSVADNVDEITRKPRKDQDQPAPIANPSSKIVNISVNVNTWKPPHYQEKREVLDMDSRRFVQESEASAGKSGVGLMKENSNSVTAGNGNAIPAADAQRESPKTLTSTPGLYSTGRPAEDADLRTIFVSNVHFAATKDSLSRHFNKFGEVIKVVIVTDAATGQPKGSAYIEFMRKEAAENALSLDGTSFMSRILKVVRKSSAHQEAAPIMTWPRIARGSLYGASRFGRVPFPRGIPSLYRPRLPIKPGARSLQWKRDAQTTPSDTSALASSNSFPSPTTRSLTYVRPDPKTNGNSGTV